MDRQPRVVLPRCNRATRRSAVAVKRPIRTKLLIGLGLLLLVVGLLAGSGLYTTYAYRGLVKSLSSRVSELPLAAELSQHVGDLRITLGELHGLHTTYRLQPGGLIPSSTERRPSRLWLVSDLFRSQLDDVAATLDRYRHQLDHKLQADFQIADNEPERKTVEELRRPCTPCARPATNQTGCSTT